MSANWSEKLVRKLNKRELDGNLRELELVPNGFTNYSSNDYLGYKNDSALEIKTKQLLEKYKSNDKYSGSRLISGNNLLQTDFESWLSVEFESASALCFQSGFMANLAFISVFADKSDIILYDEACHASLRIAINNSPAKSYHFKHNDLADLNRLISKGLEPTLIICEGLYSMSGQLAPIGELLKIAEANQACLFVDEAHSIGIHGRNGKGHAFEFASSKNLVRMIGFGKAVSSNGACILGPHILKESLINFAPTFIYTTAPLDEITAKSWTHLEALIASDSKRKQIFHLIQFWKSKFNSNQSSIIQTIPVNINEMNQVNTVLNKNSMFVKGIKSPTVPKGSECFRINLCSFLTETDILNLLAVLEQKI